VPDTSKINVYIYILLRCAVSRNLNAVFFTKV